eukprot:gene18607-20483_t
MGDSSDGDSGCLFNGIMNDMKTMVPLWEDFLVKGSKFYNAIKTTASTADSFLDSFQKLADATTSSKGSTKDIGVLFTKLVMRHRTIENKLKTYIGIITDSFFGPLQEKLEEWKKTASQLEKDHSKDFKKAKSEAKKSASEVLKLKKKVVKKGRAEYYEQYRDALKLANINVAALEDQERQYLRRLMLEERARVVFFFNCYRPVVEQELSLVSEVEILQTVLDDAIKECKNPATLPLMAEDAIKNYKAPEQIALPKSESSSPPPSPTLESARQRAFTSIPKGTGSLQRSHTVSGGSSSGYSTLRKKGSGGPAPKPIGIPTLTKSPTKSPTRSLSNAETTAYDTESRGSFHSSSGNVSNFSSMSSLSTTSADHMHPTDAAGTGEQGTTAYDENFHEQVAYYTQHDAKAMVSGSNGMQNPHQPMQATRTSWSSLETSDSSGIGSYCSLNSQGRVIQQTQDNSKPSGYHSDGQYEATTDGYLDYEVNEEMYIQMSQMQNTPVSLQQQNLLQQQQFKRNTDATSSLRGTRSSGAPNYRRSNSLTDGDAMPTMSEYRMTMPRRPSNTVYAKNTTPGARPTAFQMLANQSPAQLRAKLSPTGSPVKSQRPNPVPARKVSSPPNLYGSSRPNQQQQQQLHQQSDMGNGNGVYASNNAVYSSHAATQGVPTDRSAYVTSSVAGGESRFTYADNNGKHRQGSGNEYAVPNVQPQQPASPGSPVDFPQPPSPMQPHKSYQQELQQQQQQQAKYQTTQQLQQMLAQQQQNSRPQYTPPQHGIAAQHNHDQQQQHYENGQPQYQYQQSQYQRSQQHYDQQFSQQQQTVYTQQQQFQRYQSNQLQSSAYTHAINQQQQQHRRALSTSNHSPDDDLPAANPGSFLDELQRKRTVVRRRTLSADANRHYQGNS